MMSCMVMPSSGEAVSLVGTDGRLRRGLWCAASLRRLLRVGSVCGLGCRKILGRTGALFGSGVGYSGYGGISSSYP